MAHEAMDSDFVVQSNHNTEQPTPAELLIVNQGTVSPLQPTPADVANSQGRPLLLQSTPPDVVSSQGRAHLLQPLLPEVFSSQGVPLLPQPPPQAVDPHGGPPVLQQAPTQVTSSQEGPPLLQPAPQVSIDLTEVELSEGNVENLNRGASEEHRPGSSADRSAEASSLDPISGFISGLQRLHGIFEFLRPPISDHSVGPLRARRRRGTNSYRTRARTSQRTGSARSRAPLDTYFQVSRTQPVLIATSYGVETRNPVTNDMQGSSSSGSDSDGSTEEEDSSVQGEDPGAVVSQEQQGGVSRDQEDVYNRDETRPEQSPQKTSLPLPSASMDEEEGDTCTICFEQWTNAGDHRLSALRCGHLFGYRCIFKWLKGQTRKCPQCNKKAKHSDIVVLYARTLKALDTVEQENLKSALHQEQMLRKQAELESAQCRLQLQVLTDECSKLRSHIQDLLVQQREQTSQHPASSRSHPSCLTSSQGQHRYIFQKTFIVSQTGNCRNMAYCNALSCLVVSQPSPEASFLPGFGVKMLSTANMKSSQYIPMHSKQIRDLAFSSQPKNLLLSASLDSTIKLTSLETNTVVQTYNTGRPVWSCCWCLDENNYVYAGLANGSVLVYDLRNTNCHVQELVPQRSRCPLVSLAYLPRAASAAFPYGGVVAGTLESASFWELKTGFSYWPHALPLEAGGYVDFQTESSTRHCLVTIRPDKTHNTMRAVLMEMSYKLNSTGEPVCSCHPVQSFLGGPTCKFLTKSAIFPSPENDGSILVGMGNEASNSAMLWDAGSGSLLQDLQTQQPVVAICPFEVNHSSYLATLTEKIVHIYKWE